MLTLQAKGLQRLREHGKRPPRPSRSLCGLLSMYTHYNYSIVIAISPWAVLIACRWYLWGRDCGSSRGWEWVFVGVGTPSSAPPMRESSMDVVQPFWRYDPPSKHNCAPASEYAAPPQSGRPFGGAFKFTQTRLKMTGRQTAKAAHGPLSTTLHGLWGLL